MVSLSMDHDEGSSRSTTAAAHLSPPPQIMENDNPNISLIPPVGKIFDAEVDAYKCYNAYGSSIGFGVVTKSSKSTDGVKTNIVYSCHKAGKHKTTRLNPIKLQPTTKTDCGAHIRISRQRDGKWRLNGIDLEHNHALMDPDQIKYLRCNRIIPAHVKRRFELNAAAGIKLNKTMASFVLKAGGPQNLSYTEKKIRNYLDGMRRLQLKEGNAEAMTRYFQKMQKDNSEFYYSIDLDDENRLRNVFWADARSRQAYKEFGDVVTFDTTYLVNRFDMPFAPFIDVNHHGQTILFGCGLVSHEDTNSFVWLFTVWLECMFDLPPEAIITDQCKAMQNAISQVFPNARHRWCLWHIMKKIPDKLKGYDEYESIKFKLKNVVYDTLSPSDFERGWVTLIREYNLEDNDWLCGLYDDREMWVPAFVKYIFWAGISTTQRSESINAFFDGYVKSSTTLKEFVEQYENALCKKVQKEEEEDARCKNVRVDTISPFQFEEQFQVAYTVEKFQEFQEQLAFLIGCTLMVGSTVDEVSEFVILHKKKVGNKRPTRRSYTYIVQFNEESKETSCNCRLFESKGIVCAHIVSVWGQKMFQEVPEKYILKRWIKDLARSHTNVKVSYANWKSRSEWHRFDNMLNVSREGANKAMNSDQKTAFFVDRMTETIELMEKMSIDDFINKNTECTFGEYLQDAPTIIGDPVKGCRRGRPPENRSQPMVEKVVKKAAKKRTKKSNKIGKHVSENIINEGTDCYRPKLHEDSTNAL